MLEQVFEVYCQSHAFFLHRLTSATLKTKITAKKLSAAVLEKNDSRKSPRENCIFPCEDLFSHVQIVMRSLAFLS